jgi:lipopolysaccharide transport system permease protein
MWLYRSVLRALAGREIKGRYKQASLGVGWALFQPVVQVLVFSLVFAGLAKVTTEGNYAVFALAGLIPHNFFQQSLTLSTPALVSNQGIITKVYFPRIFTVLASMGTPAVNAVVSLVMLMVLFGLTGTVPPKSVFLAVPLLVATVSLTIGLGAGFSVLNAKVRDVQHALPLMLSMLVFLSPALYPLKRMSVGMRTLAMLNPLTGLIDGFRSAVTGIPLYSMRLTVIDAAVSFVALFVGVAAFQRAHPSLIDVL